MLPQTSDAPVEKDQESYWALSGLPPFPAVASRLLGILANDDFETRKLVDLIRVDPMFASELLHTANSVKYGLKKEISSIQHAVAILGRDTLKSFAIAVSLRMYLGRAIQQDALARVWRHSLATAVICELLAEACRELRLGSRDDTPYVAGLLHDVGCLGLMVLHPQEYANALAIAAEEAKDLREVERTLFDIDHCQAGRRIARSWKFSPLIADVAFKHHLPPSGVEFTLVDLVKVAVLAADSVGYSITPPRSSVTLDQIERMLPASAQKRFRLTPEQLREAIDERICSFVWV